ncbi:glycine betaine ABC transporter substrate-binding protein [Aliamphritea spongicola]|uniref:glycine betaine ABC transporter substrate-binding protein n=1 Tax=Aliamphritea spongicola TaxID=707589 RepID=UPI00196A9578|nr:glycine betaine ABC transporter substrate-binding protein [Aliamphritea spongicola]MBN3561905.1 glycine betaine ABC transporter substrate-binding protein [Aliamphritea spongicola]
MKITKLLKTLAAGMFLTGAVQANAEALVVGGKNFTEQQLLTSMTSQYLAAKGVDVDTRAGMGTAVLRKAQVNGQIDLYWEYTGTALINFNKIKDPLSMEDGYNKVKELDAEKGLVWLNPSKVNNTYALAMRRGEAADKGISSLSDLSKAVNAGDELLFACNAEFAARADGLKPLQKAYGFKFDRSQVKRMDTGLTYQALKEGQVNISLVFATDGRIPAFDFVVLKDDKNYFPVYALTPVIRAEALEANPALEGMMNELASRLNDQNMAELNAKVDVNKETIEKVAKGFLTEQGLI